MEPVLLLALGGFALVGLIAWYGYVQQQKRRELLHQFALGNGWTWTARDDGWAERFDGDPFGEGDSREAANVLAGPYRGRVMAAFDYSYETHSTDSKGNRTTTTHRYAVCALAMPAAVPTLQLTPEGFLGRVGTLLGVDDLELESEDFNRRFRVRAADPRLAYAMLSPRTMQALLARPALHLRLAGTDALCWESGRHSPAELLARLDTLATLLDGVPTYVWSDLGGSTA